MTAPRHALPLVTQHASGEEIAVRIQQVLASRGLTLADVSRESRLHYGENRVHHISHHFYADVRTKSFSPRIEQVLAFSAITNYRLVDWLAVFGFRLDELSSLAASLPAERTRLLDTQVYDDEARIAWFRSKSFRGPLPPIAPLGEVLEPGPLPQLKSLLPRGPSPFLYAKVGRQDAFAFPDLLPGSIVRVDTRLSRKPSVAVSQPLYLVEHSNGLTCCRLHISKGNLLTLRSTELPYAEVALQLGRDARILGTLDLEFRFLAKTPSPEVPRKLALFWNPQPLPLLSTTRGFSQLAAEGRSRVGLSLREASARSRRIAEVLGDERFFCARATLAAYEQNGAPPHHIHKILAVCVLYSVTFREALGAVGGRVDKLGQEPIPRPIFESRPNLSSRAREQRQSDLGTKGFLSDLMEEFEEIPLFLRNSLAALTGLSHLSLRDVVWLGGNRASFHLNLTGAVLAAVNGREKKPPLMGKGVLRDQPLYLLLHRDGSYLCARCTLEGKALVIHPFADGFEQPVRLRNGVDAEVVGKLAALLRKL